MSPMYDPTSHLLITPRDPEAAQRSARLRQLAVGAEPDPEFDEFARRVAQVAEAPRATVTLVDEHRQVFAGLHAPAPELAEGLPGTDGCPPLASPERVLPRDHGFCPYVVVRRTALVLEDVRDFPRFAGNPMVDAFGVRSYLGAPMLDPGGLALGTVAAVDRVPRRWGLSGLRTIKELAAELAERILNREAPTG
ncbi:GAF domain-containing protein [Streptomyces sp. AJS327]|uniref:GAF domain-containing protein n=1 Tax=Streptomyces sp. AJS327 TaxID=2545265 RepID=UPI0015E037AA|nr:GAF domain-containing protein [Streptomyces sp. AJS327]MBA0052300.1 GAF domain-containing protein [Streptomyces sp. AJS327]